MATNAVATRDDYGITPTGFKRQLEDRAGELQGALPSHIKWDKFQSVVFSATAQNPDLLTADRRSLILACIKAAQDGLLPDGREAALVTFNTSVKEGGNWVKKQLVQYMPMAFGLRKKILQARNVDDGTALVVGLKVGVVYQAEWERGYFRYEVGTDPELQHRYALDLTEEEMADDKLVAAYSIATMANGHVNVEVMRRSEVLKVRQMSQTGALGKVVKFGKDAGKAIPPKGPWVDWEPEMWKKTVLRRHSKTLPMSGDLLVERNDEAAEFEAATDTAKILGRVDPDAPVLEDRHEDGDDLPPHDKDTGELIEEPEPKEEKKRAAAKAKPDAAAPEKKADEPSAEGNAGAAPAATDATTQGAAQSDASDQSGTNGADTAEQLKDEVDPADAIAERMDKAENIIDLERIYDDSEDAINEMDGERRGDMLRCYANNRRRLGVRTEATP